MGTGWFWLQWLSKYPSYTRLWRLRPWQLPQRCPLPLSWDFIEAFWSLDSLVLVLVVIKNSTYLSTDGLLLDDIRFYTSFFNQLLYSHVKREGNKTVHKLAKHALCISNFLVWMEDVPPPIRSVVQDDIDGFY